MQLTKESKSEHDLCVLMNYNISHNCFYSMVNFFNFSMILFNFYIWKETINITLKIRQLYSEEKRLAVVWTVLDTVLSSGIVLRIERKFHSSTARGSCHILSCAGKASGPWFREMHPMESVGGT